MCAQLLKHNTYNQEEIYLSLNCEDTLGIFTELANLFLSLNLRLVLGQGSAHGACLLCPKVKGLVLAVLK